MKKKLTTKISLLLSKAFYKCMMLTLFTIAVNATPLMAQNYFAAVGAGAGNTGWANTGVGYYTLSLSNSGSNHTALGAYSLRNNTQGAQNSGVGCYSLYSNSTGSYNTAVGHAALMYSTTGSRNTAIGNQALRYSNTGSDNIALGYSSLQYTSTGNENNAIGNFALYNNTTGIKNTATGFKALYSNTDGRYNTAQGNEALYQNESGFENVANGFKAMFNNKYGSYNVSMGSYSLYSNLTGSNNVGIGSNALLGSYGSYNVAIGNSSLPHLQSGDQNTAIGSGAGHSNTSPPQLVNYNGTTFLGHHTNSAIADVTNSTAIGAGCSIDDNNQVRLGNANVNSIGGSVGWTTLSDRSLKTNIKKSKLGIDFILALNPVTYNYTAEGKKNIEYTGLIAQEVDEAAKKTGVNFSAVDKSGAKWGIRYGELTVPLIKAVQEMDAENKELKSRIEKLEVAIANLQKGNTGAVINAIISSSRLLQNQPNPLGNNTEIGYELAATDKNAALIIRDINGRFIKQISIPKSGKGKLALNTADLAAGSYTYSLIVNNSVADSKIMVVAK
jgi:trimeric autotransporter adhesin